MTVACNYSTVRLIETKWAKRRKAIEFVPPSSNSMWFSLDLKHSNVVLRRYTLVTGYEHAFLDYDDGYVRQVVIWSSHFSALTWKSHRALYPLCEA